MAVYFFFFTGKIDLDELVKAFSDLGIPLDEAEATKLLQRYLNFVGFIFISYNFILLMIYFF